MLVNGGGRTMTELCLWCDKPFKKGRLKCACGGKLFYDPEHPWREGIDEEER